jgi:hypothetical protein
MEKFIEPFLKGDNTHFNINARYNCYTLRNFHLYMKKNYLTQVKEVKNVIFKT